MAAKMMCPSCGRTVGQLADGSTRRHKDASSGEWCAGGTAAAPDAGGVVVEMKRCGDRKRKAAGMSPDELAQANEQRPASKAIGGHGACGARLRPNEERAGQQGRCTNGRGQGTQHLGYGRCKKHGGTTPNGRKHAAMERARAEAEKLRQAQTFYGKRQAIDPEQALLEEMQRSNGVVRWLEEAIGHWGSFEREAAEIAAYDPAPDDGPDAAELLVSWLQGRTERLAGHEDGDEVSSQGTVFADDHTGLPTLVAVHSTEKALGFTDTEYSAWRKVFLEERRHLAAVAKACLDAGVAERRQQVLEARGEMIRALVIAAFRIGGLKVDQERALQIIAEATQVVVKELPA